MLILESEFYLLWAGSFWTNFVTIDLYITFLKQTFILTINHKFFFNQSPYIANTSSKKNNTDEDPLQINFYNKSYNINSILFFGLVPLIPTSTILGNILLRSYLKFHQI